MTAFGSASETYWAAAPLLRAVIGFGVGAIIGSFLAVILIRWPRGRSSLAGRSHCDSCNAPLRPFELVPILSFLLLRGRCRRCRAPVDRQHLLMESAAALVGSMALVAHPGGAGPVSAVLGWWLLLIAALDAQHHWLPDRLTLPLIAAGLTVALLSIGAAFSQRVIGAVAGFTILWGIALVYRRMRGREGMGGGDPKLLAALGAWLGWHQLPFVLLGAGLLGLASLLLARGRDAPISATGRLPLGTLMTLAAWPLWLLAA